MGKNDGTLGLSPLDEVTRELLCGIIELTPEERKELLALWKEMKRDNESQRSPLPTLSSHKPH